MSELNDLKEIAIEVRGSDLFPQGGLVYIVCTLDDWGTSAKAIQGDNRPASVKLEEYLNARLGEAIENGTISILASRNVCICSHSLINLIFGTNFMYYPTEQQEATIKHPIFGTIHIKDLHWNKRNNNKTGRRRC